MGVRISLLLPKVKEEDMFNYVKESYNELVNKVTWPTFPQLQSSTIVVMVASVIFAIVVLAMDLSFETDGSDLQGAGWFWPLIVAETMSEIKNSGMSSVPSAVRRTRSKSISKPRFATTTWRITYLRY